MLKKSFILTICFLSAVFISKAQAPAILNYQAVARNSVGTPLLNQGMQVRLSILNGSITGNTVYSEVRSVITNAVGLFVIQIGSPGANGTSGLFANVNWANGTKFLKVEIDPLGGNNFIELGTSQLVSVPYALNASSANVALSAPPVGPAGGDLSGSYPNPLLADKSVTTQKVADFSISAMKLSDQAVTTSKLADASVTDAKIITISGTKVTGNISGNATNVTGTVAITNGGTGATTATAARTNLGLENVDNTSDQNKIISNAAQAALNTKENLTNKSTITTLGTSDVLYPTQNAVKTYVDGQITANSTPDATNNVKGKIQLAGDLTGTSASPVVAAGAITTAKIADANVTTSKIADASVTDAKIVTISGTKITGNINGNATNVTGTVAISNGGTGATTATAARTNLGLENVDNTSDQNKIISNAAQAALNTKENLTNKSTITTLGTSDVLYPTQNAVKTYVDGQVTASSTPDATNNIKGKIQLAGDLTGTSASPAVAAGAITTAKIADANVTTSKIADASVTDAKIVTISGTKVTGNISGNATNVTGTVAITNGGTGATTAAAARTNLGLGNIDNTSDQNKIISNAAQAALNTKENLTNKSTITTLGTSDVLYPTQNAVKTYVDGQIGGIAALKSINGLTNNAQTIITGTTGTDVNISSAGSTHTFNIPNASGSARGLVTTVSQTFAGIKTFNNDIVVNSVAIGKGGATQADNIAVGNGARSGDINTGGNANIAIGTDAQKNNKGFYNVSVGNANLVNGSGDENTAIGYTVMANNTSGMRNTGVGLFSFYQNTTGNYNTAIGHGSLGTNTVGSYNTALGTNADVTLNSLTNATAIGYGATVAASNSIQLGNTSVGNVKTSGTITAGGVTYPNSNGTSGQVLTANTNGTASWTTVNSGITSVGTIASTSTSNGASINSGVLSLAPANGTNGGIITTSAQTIAGDKTFTGAVRGKAGISSEITSDLTINASNAEDYNSKILICNPSTGAITITFESALPTGFNCMVLQKSADSNKINFAAGSGATIKNRNNYTATAGNYAVATIMHIGQNIIVTAGDMQ